MRTPWEAGVFVYRADRLLLMHRVQDCYWHIVAGVVEYGEEIVTAAARELREEAGLHLPPHRLLELGPLISYPVTPKLRSKYGYPPEVDVVAVHSYAAEAPDGWEPTLNDEHDDYRWCDVDEAVALLYWPEARAAALRLADRLALTERR